jgi:O-antigen/teichoic acid export membrane protein
MKTEKDFLRKSIRVGIMSALNFGIMGLGGIWISREIGPASRGELTQMLLIYVILGIISETGVLGAATYFSSIYPKSCSNVLYLVRKKMIRNSLVLFPFYIFILNYFQVLSRLQTLLALSILLVSNMLGGPSHVLQAVNIDLWRKSQYTQAFSYIVIFIISLNIEVTTNFAFMLIVLPGVMSGIAAKFVLTRLLKGDYFNQDSGNNREISKEFSKYSKSGFLWIMTNETFSRVELVLASIYLSMSDLGNFSLLLSWLMISSPFSGAIGNIVFPVIARDFSSNRFHRRQIYVYLRNTLVTSFVLTSTLLILVPVLLDRIMQDVYEDYSHYVIPMAILVLLKQTSTVLAEIIRGLDLNIYYAVYLFFILASTTIASIIIRPNDPISILLIVLAGHLVNLGAGIRLVASTIGKREIL